MRIGTVTIDPPVVLAPMSGITDVSFRLLCREAGAGLVYTGLVSANALHYRSRKTAELLAFSRHEHPVCAQVFGAEPEVVAAAAAAAEAAGADVVDINMGCAVPKVLKARAGVALMADPERAEAMVRATVQAVRAPVAAKMRSGWKDRGEGAVAFAQRLERAGAALVTVHPRWARQRFLGAADWDVIAAVRRAVSIPVIGNGDVRSGADAVRMMEMTHCDGVMIGRAALGNPWVFGEVAAALRAETAPPPPTAAEGIALAKRHLSLVIADRGAVIAVREMRKHVAWYLRGMPGARALREETNRAATEVELRAVLDRAVGARHAVLLQGTSRP
jgi:tRNA-dihydrouridine synthase B